MAYTNFSVRSKTLCRIYLSSLLISIFMAEAAHANSNLTISEIAKSDNEIIIVFDGKYRETKVRFSNTKAEGEMPWDQNISLSLRAASYGNSERKFIEKALRAVSAQVSVVGEEDQRCVDTAIDNRHACLLSLSPRGSLKIFLSLHTSHTPDPVLEETKKDKAFIDYGEFYQIWFISSGLLRATATAQFISEGISLSVMTNGLDTDGLAALLIGVVIGSFTGPTERNGYYFMFSGSPSQFRLFNHGFIFID